MPTSYDREDVKTNVVAFTFLTSMRAVDDDAKRQGVKPMSHPALLACAYLHADGIPVALLKDWLGYECTLTVAAAAELLRTTLSLLQSYSMLQLDVDQRQVRLRCELQAVVRLNGERSVHQNHSVNWQPAVRPSSQQPAVAVAIGQLSLSWFLRLMRAAVKAEVRGSSNDCSPHLDVLQRRYYQLFAPVLRTAGKPCPEEVVYALLLLGIG